MKVAQLLKQFQKISRTFDGSSASQKIKLIEEIGAAKKLTSKQIHTFHDLLLFAKAYPENEKIAACANQYLNWIGEKIATSESLKFDLQNSGFSNTQLITSFSFQTIKWLLNNYPNQINLYSADSPQVVEQLKRLLPQALSDQFELYHLSIKKWLQKVNPGNKNELKTLIELIDNYTDDVWAKESFYSAFEPFVQINLSPDIPSLTNGSVSFIKPFYTTQKLQKHFELAELLPVKPIEIKSLNRQHQLELEKLARITFCGYHRETDPVTYCKTNEIKCFDAGRGFTIVLYHLQPEFRLPVESYAGYVAYKNGLPVAYGGAWIFRHRAKIGISIFPPYRGGESAYLFISLLRVYHHYYGVKQFAVQPYQIGLNNDDGIKSGAFWFYYRFGFKPIQQNLEQLSKHEFEKIKQVKNYKVPVSVLRKLAHSQLEWKTYEDVKSLQDTSVLSAAYIHQVNKNYNGNYAAAQRDVIDFISKKLKINLTLKAHLQSLELFAPILSLILNLDEWSKLEQKQLSELIRLRSSETELAFQLKLAAHGKLCNLFDSIKSTPMPANS